MSLSSLSTRPWFAESASVTSVLSKASTIVVAMPSAFADTSFIAPTKSAFDDVSKELRSPIFSLRSLPCVAASATFGSIVTKSFATVT